MKTFEFEAIGTHWKIDLPDSVPVSLQQVILDRIEVYDRVYSRFRTDSTIWKLSQAGGVLHLDQQGKALFTLYKSLYDLSDGLVTPLIGQTLAQVGYDHHYSFIPSTITSPPAWEEILELSDDQLLLKRPFLIDTGAAGKGQLIDIVSGLIEEQGIETYIVDAGGDIRHYTGTEGRIGLEHPDDSTKVIGVTVLHQASICGSAGNRRTWGNYHHVFHPKTLTSVNSVLATWVIAETTMLADGLSTALFFVEPERLTAHFDFAYVILYPDYSVKYSKNFQGEIY
jgi:thiamine biosynthesis lipoprotein